jgi:IclR family transcriptional regulator, KDG regulon repressor
MSDRPTVSNQEYSTVKDLARILAVLNDFRAAEKSIAEIAKTVQMHPTKVSRMLRTLEKEGFFERNDNTGKFRLGLIFAELGMVCTFHNPVRNIIRPHVEQIAQELDITASWGIFRNYRIISMDRFQKAVDLAPFRVGVAVPIHATAPGKVLLAYLPEEEQNKFFESTPLERYTGKTITDPQLLKEELGQVVEKGYAMDDGESFDGLNCVSAPIRNGVAKVIGALTILDSEVRTSSKALFRHADYLASKALFISRQLGY